ncbi:hypothetical protein [Persicitalea jodogahamensis]|uniref:Uncharacterized protein n=1 Tax=Persicitalea jodogahamensis TaxID=402147 RepID=A0A8J3D8L3_9BACT|nr:hypothetical protein [Persicitalea jodogahamensis]GHB68852.1 hypothetical protein GCM10007390_22910 [Persicitalea jodogahamensis]
MKRFIICCFLISFSTAQVSLGQIKYEKEYRLKAVDIPPAARQFVDSLDFERRVRWYVEVSQQGKSIEAKSKRGGQKYSVEFDTTGRLQDVEIEVSWRDLPEALRKNIEQNLENEFKRFRIRKVQRQFTGKSEDVLNYLGQRGNGNRLTIKYELVLRGRKDGETDEFEYTFSAEGRLEKRAKLVFRNTDNLEY